MYCCALVCIGGCCAIVGTVVGAVYAELAAGLDPEAGCSAEGTFEGRMLEECEPCGVACWILNAGGCWLAYVAGES